MLEKPNVEYDPLNMAILARYVITPDIFDILENHKTGKCEEIQLTDDFKTLVIHEAIYAYNFEGKRYDVGDKLGFLEATVDFALKRTELRDQFMEFLNKKTKKDINDEEYKEEVASTV